MEDELPFFVYGTLRASESNSHLLRGAIARSRPALLKGARMFDLGPYPMIVESGEGVIWGEFIEIEPAKYTAILKSLDRLEGVDGTAPENPAALYRRLRRQVRVEAQTLEAWVYFGRDAVARRGKLVESGDWVGRFERAQPG